MQYNLYSKYSALRELFFAVVGVVVVGVVTISVRKIRVWAKAHFLPLYPSHKWDGNELEIIRIICMYHCRWLQPTDYKQRRIRL
jgi:hypothetical protein